MYVQTIRTLRGPVQVETHALTGSTQKRRLLVRGALEPVLLYCAQRLTQAGEAYQHMFHVEQVLGGHRASMGQEVLATCTVNLYAGD